MSIKDYSCDFSRLRALVRAADNMANDMDYTGLSDEAARRLDDVIWILDTARRMADGVLLADEGHGLHIADSCEV